MVEETLDEFDDLPPRRQIVRADDIDFLLTELRTRVEALYSIKKNRDRQKFRFILLVNAGILSVFPGFIVIHQFKDKLGNVAAATATAMALGFGILGLVVSILQESRHMSEETKLKRSIVLRLTRRMSQIGDRGKVSFAQRILIDIALAEAEAVLGEVRRDESGSL